MTLQQSRIGSSFSGGILSVIGSSKETRDPLLSEQANRTFG